MQRAHYRPDIDGLRAIAVVAVLLFHAELPGFTGGFLGVDVFFVISGFLITGVIFREIDGGTFSLLRFYERRARRIMPALLVVIAAVLAGAAWLYLPGDFEAVPRAALAAVLFVSNVFFFAEVGYFDTAAEIKPLLHTWSLGVEEQFYIGFPLLLMLLRRAPRRVREGVIALAVAASFALALWMTGDRTGFAFYLLPTRAWELGVGALLALGAVPGVPWRPAREAVAAVGLASIVAAAVLLDRHAPVPGVGALAPVLGAAAVLHCAPGTRTGRLLASRPFVAVGLVSYSLYLWHWPLLAFARYAADRPLLPYEAVALLALAGLLAALSWRFVEQPFRRARSGQTPARVLAGTALAMTVVAGIAGAMIAAGAWPQRFDARTVRLAQGRLDVSPVRDRCHDADVAGRAPCVLGAKVPPTALLWGDSHGVELAYVLGRDAARAGRSVEQRSHSSCPPVLGYDPADDPACRRENQAVMARLTADPRIRTVYLAAFWASQTYAGPTVAAQLRATIVALVAAGKRVVVIGPVPPNAFDVPRRLAHLARAGALDAAQGSDRIRVAAATDTVRLIRSLRSTRDVAVIDTLAILCPRPRCRLADGDRSLYFDSHHLSVTGAERVLHPGRHFAPH